MTSSLATLVNNLSSLAKSAVDAAVQPGADPAPKIIDSVSDMSAEELKRYVPGTVLQIGPDQNFRKFFKKLEGLLHFPSEFGRALNLTAVSRASPKRG